MKQADVSALFSPAVAVNAVLLVLVLGAGIAALVIVRRRLRPPSFRQGGQSESFSSPSGPAGMTGTTGFPGGESWEKMLAGYKNLRDEGVLSEEEFRKIRTLVEPQSRPDVPELRPRHRPPADPAGPAITRE